MAKKDAMDKLLAREERSKNLVASISGVEEIQDEKKTELESGTNQRKRGVVRPVVKETRSAKFQALLTPSLKKKAEKKAAVVGLSLNEVLNQLLEDWTDSE